MKVMMQGLPQPSDQHQNMPEFGTTSMPTLIHCFLPEGAQFWQLVALAWCCAPSAEAAHM